MCNHDWFILEEVKTCIITEKGHVFDQYRICDKCNKEEKRQVIYSHVGIGWTPKFEGVYNG